ncbi:phage tail protein [Latilactobacillus fragifolii]|uniref:phage tail protein n=1 Tax=Latilactobacillus fragifolii TaxID=2814244 RepID=UPI001ABAF510|nr:tape measure protein [Latilactobacillus fragifolii]
MSFDGSMKAVVSADITNYLNGMDKVATTAAGVSGKVNGSLGGMGNGAKAATEKTGFLNTSIGKIAAGVGAVSLVSKGIGVLKDSIGGAIGRFDTLNQYPKVMAQMGFSTDDTTKSVGILKKGVDGLPTSLQDLTKSAQSFAILEKSATGGAKTATALNDAFLASGASAADASRGVEQYSQMLSTGKVDLMSWRTLQETMPYALTKVAKSFGITGKSAERDLYDKLKSGDITMDQLNKRFTELDGGVNGFAATARTATSGIGTSFTNMKNAVVNGLANTVTAIDNGLKSAGIKNGIAGVFNSIKSSIISSFSAINKAVETAIPPIISTIKGLIDFVNKNQDWIKPLALGITAGITAFKIWTGAIKTWQTITKIATGVQVAFNAVVADNPIGLIVSVIVAVVAALVYFFTQTKTGKKVWQDFISFLNKAWKALTQVASNVWGAISDAVTGAAEGVKNGWDSVVTFFSNLWTNITTSATNTWTSFTGTLSSIWGGVISVAQSIWGAISGFFSGLWTEIVNVATTIWNTFAPSLTAIWQGIVTVAQGVWEILKSVIMGPILIVIDFLTGSWTQLGADLQLIWSSIVTGASTIWNGLVTFFTGILNFIETYFSTVWNGISTQAVAIWNGIVSAGQAIWNGFVSALSAIWSGLVNSAIAFWNALKNGTISIFNGIVNGAVAIWNGLVSGVKALVNGLVSGVVSMWNGLRSSVVSIANGIKDGAINAWNGLVSGVKNIVSTVVGVFDGLRHIDLLAAGRAVINGFVKGLKGAWEAGKKFISGIGDWIREHKGPISYDKKLLIPAGNAIMTGFGNALDNSFSNVKSSVSSYAGQLSGAMNNVSFNGAISKVQGFANQLQNPNVGLVANTSLHSGTTSLSENMDQDILNAPSSVVNLTVEQNWDGDKVYYSIKNKDARERVRINVIKK